MAEHNLVLGTAVKSLGDITLYRRGGKQISRARVRNVANPKSEGQSCTRNFLSPVVKFYGAYKDVLVKSYQGLSKDASYNEFLRTNIDLARRQGWFLDKGTPFFPLPYKVSRGVLVAPNYGIDSDADGIYGTMALEMRVTTQVTVGMFSEAMHGEGYQYGDAFTFLAVTAQETGDYTPQAFSVILNPLSTVRMTSLVPAGIEVYFNSDEMILKRLDGEDYGDVLGFAVIVSRPARRGYLRSTSYMAVAPSILTQLTSAESRASSIASYGPNESSEGGDSYLDGDGRAYNIPSISGRSLLFYGGQYAARCVSINGSKVVQLKPANLDAWFFARTSNDRFLVSNSAGSLDASTWILFGLTVSGATDDNTILIAAGSDFQSYLASIGCSVSP